MVRRSSSGYGRFLVVAAGACMLLAGATVVSGQPQEQPAPQDHPQQGQPQGQPREGQPGQRPPRGPGRPEGPGGGAREMASVEGGMKAMRQGLRMLKESVSDPAKKDASLQAVLLMQRGCLAAKAFEPKHLKAGITVDEYRREQIKLMGMLLELETDILDGKTDKAAAMVESLAKYRDDAHAKFGEGDDHEGGLPPLVPPGGGNR